MQSSWSWSSSSGCSQMGTTQTKVVQTTIRNGQVVTTTTINGLPVSSQSSVGFNGNTYCQVEQPQNSMTSAKPQVATSAAPGQSSQFEQDCLDEHNRLRAFHGCPPLKLNRNLCAFANEWANNIANRNAMEHRRNNKYGENIFMAGGQTVDGRMAVKNWYDEIARYNFSNPGFSSGTGHFTQVVWKGSTELGVGVQQRGMNTWVVANYNPPGNMMGDFPQNVPKRIR